MATLPRNGKQRKGRGKASSPLQLHSWLRRKQALRMYFLSQSTRGRIWQLPRVALYCYPLFLRKKKKPNPHKIPNWEALRLSREFEHTARAGLGRTVPLSPQPQRRSAVAPLAWRLRGSAQDTVPGCGGCLQPLWSADSAWLQPCLEPSLHPQEPLVHRLGTVCPPSLPANLLLPMTDAVGVQL